MTAFKTVLQLHHMKMVRNFLLTSQKQFRFSYGMFYSTIKENKNYGCI